MANGNSRMGSICAPDSGIDLDSCLLVAEVMGYGECGDSEGIVASFILVDGLDAESAQNACNFFAAQPSLIVDTAAAVDVSRAPLPAKVLIRHTDDAKDYVATVYEFGVLQEMPHDGFVKRGGWDLFLACEAIASGVEPPLAEPLPSFDYRSLRRKVYANRAGTEEDRNPWLQGELDKLREITRDEPEGFEVLAARADDIEAVMKGDVVVGDGFSVIIPTMAERLIHRSAIADWVRQAGREVVIAHGLDAFQAARVLELVKAQPEAFISKDRLLKQNARESVLPPVVIADSALNWITTDFSGRRSSGSYDLLVKRLNGPVVPGASVHSDMERTAGRSPAAVR